MRKILPIVGLAALLIFLGTALARRPAAQSAYRQAPDFTVTDINGKTISLSQYRGKVLFLNFWATWCPPCRAEIPDFVDVYEKYKSKGIEILGISLDTKEKSAIVDFAQKFKINYPVVLESKKLTDKLLDDFQPGQFIPTTFVIDKLGRIRDKVVRSMDKEEILRYFDRLIAE
jgi:cytochrome c biogenesis protein CcmG/thiol:disulfide interchange protein DsbE